MIRAAAFALALAFTSAAAAQAPAPAYSVAATTIGELLDNPATKAVLNKYIPEVVSHPQIDQGRPMTLPQIVEYAPQLTPELLAKIDADLKTVAKK